MHLTADSLSLHLIEGGSFLVGQTITRQDTVRFDDALGRYLVDRVTRKGYAQDEIDFIANAVFLHCGRQVLARFATDVEKIGFTTAYDFAKPPTELVKPGYQGLENCPLLDTYRLGRQAHTAGWEYQWCPFRNAAEVLWTAGWRHLPEDAPNVLDAQQFLAELQHDLRRRAQFRVLEPLVATRLP